MKVFVVDNYDSFVYNLVYMLRQYASVIVQKNDQLNMSEVAASDKILLSPGPGVPSEAGAMPEILQRFAASKSILGVCLGHQAIAENFGASLYNLPEPLHGQASRIRLKNQQGLLAGTADTFQVGHYHSWVVDPASCPPELELLAEDERGNIMAIRHRTYDVYGLQFHPESILTDYGHQIIQNWIYG